MSTKRAVERTRNLTRRLLKARPSEQRDAAMRKVILQIPRGKVATYSQVAAAAGKPGRKPGCEALVSFDLACGDGHGSLLERLGNSVAGSMPVLGPGINLAREKGVLFPRSPGCERGGLQKRFDRHGVLSKTPRRCIQTNVRPCAGFATERKSETHAVLDCRDRFDLGRLRARVRAPHRRLRSCRSKPWGERESAGGGQTAEYG